MTDEYKKFRAPPHRWDKPNELLSDVDWLRWYHVVAERLKETVYVPGSLTLNAGTSSDAVADVQTLLDGNTYDIAEVAATPGFDVEFTFTVDIPPNGIITRLKYVGLDTHGVGIDLYNYTTTTWDRYHSFLGNHLDYVWIHVDIPDMTDYIDNLASIVRLYHFSAGDVTHDIYIDYIALRK